MNILYICKVSDYQAQENQIDIPTPIAINFFRIPSDYVEGQNFKIHICHSSEPTSFEDIEIQTATNIRFSTKLNTFLERKGDPLTADGLLVFEKILRSFVCHCVNKNNAQYSAIIDLFEAEEKHMLLMAVPMLQQLSTDKIESVYLTYITAIKTKPFLLLAGISGTGKSRIVRQLAKSCWNPDKPEEAMERDSHKPKNFEMIQVKPNWHDSAELIGFESRLDGGKFIVGPFLKFIVKAMHDSERPYFLCLDEMNLAPVEQYFAEYLSVLESRELKGGKITTDPIIDRSIVAKYGDKILEDMGFAKVRETQTPQDNKKGEGSTEEQSKDAFDRQDLVDDVKDNGLCIPQNLIVIGTVNMDETTYGFSRKVLDRAMTIEMNEVKLNAGLSEEDLIMPYIKSECFIPDCVEGKDVFNGTYNSECKEVLEYLENINNELENSPFKIAYRTRNEFLVYVVNSLRLAPEGEDKNITIAKALDQVTSMKVLSRIEGDKKRVGTRIDKEHLQKVVSDMLESYKEKSDDVRKALDEYESISLAKLKHMEEKLANGYTDFWD